jgi:adenine phosphoribosyltransferase
MSQRDDPASSLAWLRSLVVDVPDFPSAGIVFRDITPLLGDATALQRVVDALAEPHRERSIDLVAGIESRGFILGGALAIALGAGFVPVRKQGRLPRSTVSVEYQLEYGSAALEVHADAAVRGQRVLVVDDVLATGGTAAAALHLLQGLSATVAGCSVLIELSALGGRARLGDIDVASLLVY